MTKPIVSFRNFGKAPKITWTSRINLRNYNGISFVGKPDDTRELEDLSVETRIILKSILEKKYLTGQINTESLYEPIC
jgi:hypothetical protein